MSTISQLVTLLEKNLRTTVPPRFDNFTDVSTFADSINDTFSILSAILSLIAPDTASTDPVNRIYVTKNADDPYGGDIQAAIDSIGSQATASNKFVVEVLSPGVYQGPITLPEYVWLMSPDFAPNSSTRITSSSTATVTMPSTNSGVLGLVIENTSNISTDSALQVTGGSGSANASFITFNRCYAPNGARAATIASNPNESVTSLWAVFDGANANPAIFVQSGSFTQFNTGQFEAPISYLQAEASAFVILQGCILNTRSTAGGWTLDINGGSVVLTGNNTFFEANNGIRARNGGTLVGNGALSFGSIPGTTLEVALGSAAFLSPQFGLADPFSVAPYAGWSIAGTLLALPNAFIGSGTLAGRPATPIPGMKYYAIDANYGGPDPGTGATLWWEPNVGWVDQTGTIHP